MNSAKEIGGYFELELKEGSFLHDNLVQLNSGRNSFEYALRLLRPTKVYFPKFTCDVMLEPLIKLNIEYSFYSIDENFEIVDKPKLKEHEIILYTNYFGVKDKYSRQLSKLYKNSLILDCSQAYYFKPLKLGYTFYSPRKFFGVSDGGLLSTDKLLDQDFDRDISSSRIGHLTERLELGAEAGYKNFKINDGSLVDEPIKQMSVLTHRLLGNIDFDKARKKRQENAAFLHSKLGEFNQLKVEPKMTSCLMVYPLLIDTPNIREHLIANKVFTALYWPNVLEWCKEDELEHYLSQNLLPLPIDQRYSAQDMEYIVKILIEAISD
ncbi:MAG: hypothetical protein ACOH18_04415 [Candidatus Saccharimonadaceae bacterium]